MSNIPTHSPALENNIISTIQQLAKHYMLITGCDSINRKKIAITFDYDNDYLIISTNINTISFNINEK